MTDWDMQWQDKIAKVVKRRWPRTSSPTMSRKSAELVRRRLFEDIGSERVRKNVAKVYADWCFERRAQLAGVDGCDSAETREKGTGFSSAAVEVCYPFHPAALSVFQRKWQALPQYQQTRGTLAMLAQWISVGLSHRV